MSSEILRKTIHTLLALAFAVVGVTWGTMTTVVLALLMLLLVVGVRTYGGFLPYQVPRITYGEVFFAVGVAASAALFLSSRPDAFVVGMVVLGLVDTAAALVGRRWGAHTYTIFGELRSYEGSLSALCVAMVIFYVWGVGGVWAFLAAWIIAAVEALAPRGSDNMALPLVAGTLLLLLV